MIKLLGYGSLNIGIERYRQKRMTILWVPYPPEYCINSFLLAELDEIVLTN
jgi:hypothetical protein